jgi:hypothetical protein
VIGRAVDGAKQGDYDLYDFRNLVGQRRLACCTQHRAQHRPAARMSSPTGIGGRSSRQTINSDGRSSSRSVSDRVGDERWLATTRRVYRVVDFLNQAL